MGWGGLDYKWGEVGCVIMEWGKVGGVCHAGVGWGGLCRGGVGHALGVVGHSGVCHAG